MQLKYQEQISSCYKPTLPRSQAGTCAHCWFGHSNAFLRSHCYIRTMTCSQFTLTQASVNLKLNNCHMTILLPHCMYVLVYNNIIYTLSTVIGSIQVILNWVCVCIQVASFTCTIGRGMRAQLRTWRRSRRQQRRSWHECSRSTARLPSRPGWHISCAHT